MPTGLCPIPEEHPQKKVVGDGGAKHRSIDPPTEWHSVADPHAVATMTKGGTQATQTAFASIPAYGPISTIKASYFGKKILRMTGIVRMLHTIKPPYGHRRLNTRMPTQREYEQYNKPEHKRDHHPARRLRFLDHEVPTSGSALIIKTIVCTLALYGLYRLFF